MATLIVGVDSLIGGALAAHLRPAGEEVTGTTRRPERVTDDCLYLDLSEDVAAWRSSRPVDVAVICAGVTKVADCRLDPLNSSRVNVEGVCALAENLSRSGTFPIFLSTCAVFDGTRPNRQADEQVSPVMEYGRQNAEAEQRLSRLLGDAVGIVRLTKVLEPRHPLFSRWTAALKQGETINPFSDMYFAPIPLSCAVSVLRLAADRRLPGILQVSGGRDLSYAEAARIGARALGAADDLVQPIKACQAGLHVEDVPTHTTLSNERLMRSFGIDPPDVSWTIEAAFSRPESLGPLP